MVWRSNQKSNPTDLVGRLKAEGLVYLELIGNDEFGIGITGAFILLRVKARRARLVNLKKVTN